MLLKNKNLKISLAAIDIILILFILASAYIFLDTQKQEANDGNSNLNLMIPAEVSDTSYSTRTPLFHRESVSVPPVSFARSTRRKTLMRRPR